MVKALFDLAKYLTWSFIKPLVSRCCVANLTNMLQTSSFNQTHVLVALNSISLSCLEGRIYIITSLNPLPVLIILLNPIPVLVALKILWDILSFTRSFMIYTRLQKSGPLREQPTGKVMIETHQSQLLKINQSQRSIMLYKVSRKQSTSSPTSTQSKRRDLQFKVTTSWDKR